MLAPAKQTKVPIGSKWHLPKSVPQMALCKRPWVARTEGVFVVLRRDVCRVGGMDFIHVVMQLDDGKPIGDCEAKYAYVVEPDLLEHGECVG